MTPEAWATIIASILPLAGGLVVWGWNQRAKIGHPGSPEIGHVPEPQKGDKEPDPARIMSRRQRITSEGVIRVGCIKHPPLADFEVDTYGDYIFSGLYVEMALELGRTSGLTVMFTPVDWSELKTSFTDLSLDLVLSVFESSGRREFADFVAAMHKVAVTGVVRSDDMRVHDISDLYDRNIRIAVVRGEIGWEYAFRELRLPRHRVVVLETSGLGSVFSLVQTNAADLAIVDDLTCRQVVAANPDLRQVFRDDPLYLCKNAIMVPKGEPDYAEWIDALFAGVRRLPSIADLELKVIDGTGGGVRRFR